MLLLGKGFICGFLHHIPNLALGFCYALKHSRLQEKPLACLGRTELNPNGASVDLAKAKSVEE